MSAHPDRNPATPEEGLSFGQHTPTDPISEKAASEISHNSTLASRPHAYPTKRGPVTDAVVNFFSIKKRYRDTELLDDIATQPSVYDTEQAEHYQPRADWENIEAFDPSFRWTWREEAKALRKVDWKVLSWVCVMFFALDIDRANIKAATADDFLKDLGLTQSDYNLGNTLSKLGFLLAELPSQLVSKRLGPDVWIPMQVCIFSVLSAAQFWLNGRSFFFATRFLIAAFQGGFIPDNVLYLSYWYNKYDLPIRLAIFYTINPFTDIVTSFLGAGLLQMRGVLGYAGWRWMFLLEGLFTLLIGIASFWMMPTAPSKTKTNFRPNGYITDNEAKIIVNRVIRDEPTKGNMHNRQALTLKMIAKSCMDWHLWPVYIIGVLMWIPITPVSYYLQLSFRQLGFSKIEANLLAVPYGVLSIINVILIAMISELFDNRSFTGMIQFVWITPCLIALVALKNISGWQYFAILTVLLGYPYVHAVQVAWCSRNAGSIRTRTVAASLYNMAVQLSQIIGANVYQASDAPRYVKGNTALLVICGVCLVLYPLTYLFYRNTNTSRDKKWDAMDPKEKSEYLRTTKDEGNKRLDFRFAT